MVRVGILLAILAIALMVWAYQHTHAADYPRDPGTLENPGVHHLVFGADGPRPGRPLRHSPHGQLNPLVESLHLGGGAAHHGVADPADLRAAAASEFFGLYPLSGMELAICFGFSALLFVEGEKLFIQFALKRKRL
jgi:Ca2+-transporting ATPase